MAQCIKGLCVEPDYLGSVSGTHSRETPALENCPLTSMYVPWHMHAHTHTHRYHIIYTRIKLKEKRKIRVMVNLMQAWAAVPVYRNKDQERERNSTALLSLRQGKKSQNPIPFMIKQNKHYKQE